MAGIALAPHPPAYTDPPINVRTGLIALHTPPYGREAFAEQVKGLLTGRAGMSTTKIALHLQGMTIGLVVVEMMSAVEGNGEALHIQLFPDQLISASPEELTPTSDNDQLIEALEAQNISRKLLRENHRPWPLNPEDKTDEVSRCRASVDPSCPQTLNNLAMALISAFSTSEETALIDEAIDLFGKVLSLTPSILTEDYCLAVQKLASSLSLRFAYQGKEADLEQSIELSRQAVQMSSNRRTDGHSKAIAMQNFATILGDRFFLNKHLSDLDGCISLSHQALEHSRKPSRTWQAVTYSGLVIFMTARYIRSQLLEDGKKLIQTARHAERLLHDPSEFYNSTVNSAFIKHLFFPYIDALVYFWAYTYSTHPNCCDGEVDEAISILENACHRKHPQAQHVSHALANAKMVRYYLMPTGPHSIEDLESAIIYCGEAFKGLSSSLHDSQERMYMACWDFYLTLREKYERLGVWSEDEISLCLETIRCHASQLPKWNPERPSVLANLGIILVDIYKYSHAPKTADEANAMFETAIDPEIGSINARYDAASLWALFMSNAGLTDHALEGTRQALKLRRFLAVVGTDARLRYEQISVERSNNPTFDMAFVPIVVANAINACHFEDAVVFLEEGKNVIWDQNLNLRPPLHALQESAPDIAINLQAVCAELENLVIDPVTSTTAVELHETGMRIEQAQQLVKQRDALLDEIRQLPDFADFLCPKSFSQLQLASSNGPIIVLNGFVAYDYKQQIRSPQCDALLLLPGQDIVHVPLNIEWADFDMIRCSFDSKNSREACLALRDITRLPHRLKIKPTYPEWGPSSLGSLQSKNSLLLLSLKALWDLVTEPILKALRVSGFTSPDTHVWWCPSGIFSGLPLHAAGIYPGGASCLDQVISSYTPTISALQHARSLSVYSSMPHVLVVAPTDMGDLPSLPSVAQEISVIRSIVPSECLSTLQGPEASLANVSLKLHQHSWIHFACHGYQDSANPFHSCFYLHKGDPLTLDALTKVKSHTSQGGAQSYQSVADFAFLTACHTASASSREPDETVNLAAALLSAGFRSVIASLWSMNDEDGPRFSEGVYKYLFQGGHQPDSTRAAQALNQTQRDLRDSGMPAERWACLMHMGV
ncbi:hypothetical protein BT96DRAFT_1000070 [Gymnopus androsaceus JB14]|uniref:CHAT domain-containing protein n=1 Tax=Gymnopus androsaceus JB14 TaxID=1447944 RepID=A0A6A4H6F3_9AGAR|nr:hypothetical protein BT96DRAFT_1000070 [Gymnopus androsaceus JB14]